MKKGTLWQDIKKKKMMRKISFSGSWVETVLLSTADMSKHYDSWQVTITRRAGLATRETHESLKHNVYKNLV